MATKGSNYGDIHRYDPARESITAAIAIVVLTVLEVVFVGQFLGDLVGDQFNLSLIKSHLYLHT
jgi:hypothetical protein